MKKINLKVSKNEDNSIFVGNKIFNEVDNLVDLGRYSKICLLTDYNVKKYWFNYLNKVLSISYTIAIKPGEKYKNINTLEEIWKQLISNKCDKNTLVVLCGGGVIGDMGALAAATFLRGIDFIQVPTTIISQADSSIGGKTGIDYGGGKNIIGTFYQPKAVIIDTEFLSTLPKREFISGFAEIIKHGLIKDLKYYNEATNKQPLKFSKEELETLILKSCQIKASILKDDIFQKKSRKLVLFGHTIGQSIESLALDEGKLLLHGEAISTGLLAETYLSHLIFGFPYSEVKSLKNKLLKAKLPTSTNYTPKKIKQKMSLDKKNISGVLTWTLIKKIGQGTYDVKVDNRLVDEALSYISSN